MPADAYKSSKWIKERVDISSNSLRTWADAGKVGVVRCPGGKRLYNAADINKMFGYTPEGDKEEEKERVIYARVSGSKQQPDLVRQIEYLRAAYPGHRVVRDVASGVNFKRKGLTALLDRVYDGRVGEVVVLHRDRLARLGCELLEQLFKKFGVKLVVHDKDAPGDCQSIEEDHQSDLLAVVTSFVAGYNGRRSGRNRKRNRAAEKEEENGTGQPAAKRRRRLSDKGSPHSSAPDP